MGTQFALVDLNGQAINGERFATDTEAHMSAQGGRRRFGEGKGQTMLVGRTVWIAQVDEVQSCT